MRKDGELVKKIRHCATDPMHCLSCGEDKDGRCFKRLMVQAADALEELQKRVPKAPHGRLIDAAALWVEINKICDRRDAGIITDLTCLQQLLSAVRHAPTIIPAEPCNNLSKPCKEDEP